MKMTEIAAAAKAASVRLAAIGTSAKNAALKNIGESLDARGAEIVAANRQDLAEAQANDLAGPLLKRLKFDESKIDEVRAAIDSLIKLEDPVGKVLAATELDTGLELYKVTCPIGVIGVVFESRPDALVQISCLCLKTGNAVLLKGGSEAAYTNRILAEVIAEASGQRTEFRSQRSEVGIQRSEVRGQRTEDKEEEIPAGWIQLLETRQDVAEMLKLDEYIDLVIPRGSNEFVRHIMDNTRIPVLGHAAGICHVYVHGDADVDMAVKIVVDAKCQYVAVCNAAETLLVDGAIAKELLPVVKKELEARNVELRGCEKTRSIIDVKPATEEDWATEYLDYILSIRVVEGLDKAIDHINRYGSRHTDAIVTGNRAAAEKFMDLVDSANVFWNCSTRFSDGYRYGLGAEVGVSTNKIHARGPVGLEGLVIYKWRLYGQGQIVGDYSGPNAKKFTHRNIASRV